MSINITKLTAREILDSRGSPTIEVKVITKKGKYTASVPSGASTGKHEAHELRDHAKRYLGLGVQKAIKNIKTIIAPLLIGVDCTQQEKIDHLMIKKDGTKNKSKLGANAILAVSLACARAGADASNLSLYQYLNRLLTPKHKLTLPRPFLNLINGGKHADNNLSFQEFLIAPKFNSFKQNLQVASEIYHLLKHNLHKKYGSGATNVGDEGGFAPAKLSKTAEALDLLQQAIKEAGYQNKVDLALDCAASEIYRRNYYSVDGKMMNKVCLTEYYLNLIKNYHLISLEDPFEQEDFMSFAELKKKTAKSKVQIVGDDLTVTNLGRIKQAIKMKSCNCLLLKVNQIGTLTEALSAVKLAYENGWKVMVSHRSGETEDPFIADLAVGIGCGMLKAGAPCRGERIAKYNRLLKIEEELNKHPS